MSRCDGGRTALTLLSDGDVMVQNGVHAGPHLILFPFRAAAENYAAGLTIRRSTRVHWLENCRATCLFFPPLPTLRWPFLIRRRDLRCLLKSSMPTCAGREAAERTGADHELAPAVRTVMLALH
ncbi:hypothetical protein BHE74_00006783 [Ensete ventricosum]|nr:hypothetical protein BHE74_00006783 [Ensete ventricosum]